MSVTRRELLTIALSAGLVTGCKTFSGGSRDNGDAKARNLHLRNWPANSDPAVIGKLVALNFVARDFQFVKNPRQRFVIYPEVCAWYGSLQIAALTRDESLQKQLIAKFDYFLTPEGEAHISQRAHVDFRVFGAVPLEIYKLTQQAQYLQLGRSFAEKQWESTTPDGITTEARYWSDDLYMLPLIQLQAYRATSDPISLDRAALTMVTYLQKLQQPNGLFLHSEDSPFYWARGNGWVAAGMTEMLISLPEDHPHRARILECYKLMMASLLPYQTPEGLWRQLIDQEDFWPETSGAGMFAFAMVTGVKKGWLDPELYGPAARKAWLALVAELDDSANVKDVCVGTNKAAAEVGNDPAVQRQYYFDRARRVGDLHGQAPILWTAAALLRGQGSKA
jgi:rhamnogalacturonyl hydrolase YesR